MTERDPVEALRERTALLEEELRQLDARKRERAALEGELHRVNDELDKSRALLDRFGKKRALPMLDRLEIASPCSASWDDMRGDDKSRYCSKCEKNVYNLSAMSREEAELTILAKEGDLCVRLYQRTDGTVLTQDCPVGVRRKRLRLVGVLAMGSSLAGATAAIFAGMGDDFGDDAPCDAVVEAPIEYVPQATVPIVRVDPPPALPPVVVDPIAKAPPHGTNEPKGQWLAGRPSVLPPTPPAPTTRALMGKPSVPQARSASDEEAKAREALAKARLEKSL
jgi:hypothetical protein